MKTRTLLVAVVMVLVFVILAGCGGRRYATLKAEEDGTITHNDWNMSLLQSSIGPNQLANAEATVITAKAQADLTRSLTKQVEQGQAAVIVGRYIGIIINNDPRLTAYIPHPEMNQRIKVAPGSYAILATNNIAEKISIYDSYGDYTVSQTFKKGGVYNGIKYDYGIRIYKVR